MKKLIYIVDDDPTSLVMCQKSLEKNLDVETVTFSCGEDFLEGAQKKLPDLVILDILMPGISGFEVLKKMRANKSALDLPIIMLTSENESKSMVKAFDIGASDYICKPVNSTVLAARAKNFLHLKELVSLSIDAIEFEIVNRMLASYSQKMRDVLNHVDFHVDVLIEKEGTCMDTVKGMKKYLDQVAELNCKVQEIVEDGGSDP